MQEKWRCFSVRLGRVLLRAAPWWARVVRRTGLGALRVHPTRALLRRRSPHAHAHQASTNGANPRAYPHANLHARKSCTLHASPPRTPRPDAEPRRCGARNGLTQGAGCGESWADHGMAMVLLSHSASRSLDPCGIARQLGARSIGATHSHGEPPHSQRPLNP